MKKLLTLLLLVPFLCLSQTPCDEDICVVQFNAAWNSGNDVEWHSKLKDCEIKYIDIAANPTAGTKYKITVVPTIIVFKDGEEVKRFQADISFTMKATKEEVQEVIDDNNQSDF